MKIFLTEQGDTQSQVLININSEQSHNLSAGHIQYLFPRGTDRLFQ